MGTVHRRAGAQSSSSDESRVQQLDLNAAIDNEVWLARLGYALIAVHETKAPHWRAVARLGKGETDADLNRRRLEIVQELIDARGFKTQLLSDVGEPFRELGRIELYVEDQLVDVLT